MVYISHKLHIRSQSNFILDIYDMRRLKILATIRYVLLQNLILGSKAKLWQIVTS